MSLKAITCASSYSMSAAVWPAMMRQKAQSITEPPKPGAIIRRSSNRFDEKESLDGHVSEVQATHSQERQPHQARRHVVSQVLPRASREEGLSRRRVADGSWRVKPPTCGAPTDTAPLAAPPTSARRRRR